MITLHSIGPHSVTINADTLTTIFAYADIDGLKMLTVGLKKILSLSKFVTISVSG